MGVFNENAIIGAAAAAGGEWGIDYSCRFNDGDSAYLTRTPGSTGDQTEFTFSFWMKPGTLPIGTADLPRSIFSTNTGGSYEFLIRYGDNASGITDNNVLEVIFPNASNANQYLKCSRVLRDPSAWYHIVVAVDTSQGTDSNKMKLYINGDVETAFITDNRSAIASSQPVSNTIAHEIGRFARVAGQFYDGYLAEFHFIDGTQKDADDFGERGDYGEWKPIEYTGSHGTQGYYLDFSNSAALGDDAAGSNDFSYSGLAAHDQMLDSPTNNFATLNLLDDYLVDSFTLTEGNLKSAVTEVNDMCFANFGMESGKWYWEVQFVSETGASAYSCVGVADQQSHDWNSDNGTWTWANSGGGFTYNKDTSGSDDYSHGLDYSAGNILHFAVDADNGKLWWGVNGTWMDDTSGNVGNPAGNAYPRYSNLNVTATTLVPMVSQSISSGSSVWIANFGQDGTFAGTKSPGTVYNDGNYGSFFYQPPSGFKALCTKNLTDCAITPSEYFTTKLVSGNGSVRSITFDLATGTDFQPDFIWTKQRSSTRKHGLHDVLRGATYRLQSDNGTAESINTDSVTSFDSDGFSLGTDASYNDSGETNVYWCWKSGTSQGSTATSGSGTNKTYTASYSTDAGFSIVAFTGNGTAGHTIPHHLGAKPDLMMLKQRNATSSWCVYADVNLMGAEKFLELHASSALQDSTVWNDAEPTSSVFSVGAGSDTNINDATYVVYLWRSIEGYSKVGYYIGNGNAAGPFIYTGFRPQYTIVKGIDIVEGWAVLDSARDPYNVMTHAIQIDENQPESITTGRATDHLSNGFKIRTSDSHKNTSGKYYLYMAFAEQPFKNANAR